MNEIELQYCMCGHLVQEHSYDGCKICDCLSTYASLVKNGIKSAPKSEKDKLEIATKALEWVSHYSVDVYAKQHANEALQKLEG